MDVSNNLDGLKSLLGVTAASPSATREAKGGAAGAAGGMGSDLATFSSAGSAVSQTASDGGFRADKVAGIQAALAAGTYNVPASAVAGKLVDVMLGSASE